MLSSAFHLQVEAIEKATRGQADSILWKAARVGRITASNFGTVCSQVNTLRDPDTNRSKDTVIQINVLQYLQL